MRLTDADAFINDIEELITEYEEAMRDSEEHPEKYPEDYKIRAMNLIAGLIAAKVEVANAPTIEPIKHGEWKKVKGADGGYTDFRCSNCRRYRFHNGEMLKKYLYCPNCGADMRGDTE